MWRIANRSPSERDEPQLGDSDNGGEADGSEVAAGRDPLSTSDDAIPKAPAKVIFGKSLAGLWLGGSFDNFDVPHPAAPGGRVKGCEVGAHCAHP